MYIIDLDADYEKERNRILREMISSRIERNYIDIMLEHGFDLNELFRKARRDPENPYLKERRVKQQPDAIQGRRKTDPKRSRKPTSSILRGKE